MDRLVQPQRLLMPEHLLAHLTGQGEVQVCPQVALHGAWSLEYFSTLSTWGVGWLVSQEVGIQSTLLNKTLVANLALLKRKR